MKPFEQQTYYELLEVPASAPAEDIRAAYSRLMELYAPDSIAVYALVDPEQVDSLRARMTEALEILTDADLRAEYDKDLGLPTQRMVEAIAAGGRATNEAPPGTGTVARAAEALASSAAGSTSRTGASAVSASAVREAAARPAAASSTEDSVASAREESRPAVTSTPPPAEPTTRPAGQGDFRSTFFRGFSFAYVSSSLQDTQFLGSSVYRPSATSSVETTPSTSSAAVASVSSETGNSAPVPASVSTSSASTAVTVSTEAGATAPAVAPRTSAPAAEPATTALVPVLARQEGTPASARSLPGGHAASSRGTPDTQPPPFPTASESARHARSGAGRQLGDAQVLSQDSAIATAEAALAQVAARVREPQARPRIADIPSDAEFNGELLRRVREARGQSLQQVADRTRITRSHLENVEADRYSALPPPVYLRGILMNLARELGLDPLRVSRSYLALASEKPGKK